MSGLLLLLAFVCKVISSDVDIATGPFGASRVTAGSTLLEENKSMF